MANKKEILSPLDGLVKSVSLVNDEVFSQKMLGDGVAIEPAISSKVVITSPVNGTITSTHDSKHAIGIITAEDTEILIHVGVDTVLLKGEGFTQFVKENDVVKAGDKLLEVDFTLIAGKVPSTDVIVIVTNLDDNETVEIVEGEVQNQSTIMQIK